MHSFLGGERVKKKKKEKNTVFLVPHLSLFLALLLCPCLSEMSLGFNPNRKMRTTNLPGAVGASVPLSRSTTQRQPSSSSSALADAKRVAILAERMQILKKEKTMEEETPPLRKEVAKKRKASEEREEEGCDERVDHWVFGTASSPLLDKDTGEEVAKAGERILLVYPMKNDEESGKVHMRVKRANPVTGQLSYSWVVVYDPDTDARNVHDFSMVG